MIEINSAFVKEFKLEGLNAIKTKDGTRLCIKNSKDYVSLQNFLERKGISHIIFKLKDERPVKYVIRGVDDETLPEELNSEGFPVIRMTQLKSTGDRRILPLFLVEFHLAVDKNKVNGITNIFGIGVRIEPYKISKTMPQLPATRATIHTCWDYQNRVAGQEGNSLWKETKRITRRPARLPAFVCKGRQIPGPDAIPNLVLKQLSRKDLLTLTDMFNSFFAVQYFPVEWKKASIIVFAKPNWKPIKAGVPHGSLLGPILFNLYVNDLPASLGTKLAMYADDTAFLAQSWKPSLVSNRLRGALDKAESWFSRVTKGNHFFEWKNIRAGVPQGSLLWPVLFNLYINDLPETTNTQVAMYADDTAFLAQSWKPGLVTNRLQEALIRAESWSLHQVVSMTADLEEHTTTWWRDHDSARIRASCSLFVTSPGFHDWARKAVSSAYIATWKDSNGHGVFVESAGRIFYDSEELIEERRGPSGGHPPLALGRQGTRAGQVGGRSGACRLVPSDRPRGTHAAAQRAFVEVVRLHRGPCLQHPGLNSAEGGIGGWESLPSPNDPGIDGRAAVPTSADASTPTHRDRGCSIPPGRPGRRCTGTRGS
ncbi:hypothetical protein AAG570_005432 [Ranatra chinensis]|uniref:Reverse transcriptase domain-containing protein n=1 Tax=Ranatra chinensis TaxID=642074 RepID=A0ABD0XXF0_9HEMI